MKDSDKGQFFQIMSAVGELYGKEVSEQFLSVYFEALKPYELRQVRYALNAHVKNPDNGQFLPKPADIIRILDGQGSEKAIDAWKKVMEALRTEGSYRTVVFDDPIIHIAIQTMGGWGSLGRRSDDVSYMANEFQKYYAHFFKQKPREWPRKLYGILGNEEPALIGDKDQALCVLAGESDKRLFRVEQMLGQEVKNANH